MKIGKDLERKIQGVILAAGEGERIRPLSFDLPKPLLPVCNKAIMQYQVDNMIGMGIEEYIFVVGHLKEKIMEYFGDGSSWNISVRYVEQKKKLGIAHAVGQLEEHVNSPFVLFLGDIFIIPKDLREMVRMFFEKKAAGVLGVKWETDREAMRKNFAVVVEDNTKSVKRVVEKPRYISSSLKGCGIYLFSQSIFDAIRCTPRTAMRDEYEITTAIQILIEDGCPVFASEVVGWDMNVTSPHDLLLCNQKWLKYIGKNSVISETARIAPKTEIVESVIGENVEIEYPISIRNSVILDGTVIKSKKDLNNCLISPRSVI